VEKITADRPLQRENALMAPRSEEVADIYRLFSGLLEGISNRSSLEEGRRSSARGAELQTWRSGFLRAGEGKGRRRPRPSPRWVPEGGVPAPELRVLQFYSKGSFFPLISKVVSVLQAQFFAQLLCIDSSTAETSGIDYQSPVWGSI